MIFREARISSKLRLHLLRSVSLLTGVLIGSLSLPACSQLAPTVAPNRQVASMIHTALTACSSCHTQNLPSGPVGLPSFDHSMNGGSTQDCYSCHSNPSNAGVTWAGGLYSHSPKPATCLSCHSLDRPSNSSGFVGINSNAPFDYSTHGGSLECATCHTSVSSFVSKPDWVGGSYNHSAASPTSCSTCHAAQRPTVVVSNFDHSTLGVAGAPGTTDCYDCHKASLSRSFASMSDWSGGIGMPSSAVYDTSNDLTLNASVPSFSATSIISFSTPSETLHQPMVHGSTQVDLATLQTCTNCHANAGSGNYKPGIYHSSLSSLPLPLPQPSSCNDCHNVSSVSSMPKGFVGPQGSGRNPASPEMKHDAVTWSQTKGVWSQTTIPIVTQDCATCHTQQPGSVWSGATFHASLTTAKALQPTSCLDCHANNRPTGSVPASVPAGSTAFDHANGGQGDCVSCHAVNTAWNNGQFHKNAGTQTSCSTCHSSQRPQSASGVSAYDSTNKPFDFSFSSTTNVGHGGSSMDCASCHSNVIPAFPTMTNWQGGAYTHPSNLTSCVGCHSTQRPTVVVDGFNHSTSGTGDCAGCHQASFSNALSAGFNSMSNWSGGVGVPTGLVGNQIITVSALQLNTSGSLTSTTTSVTETLVAQMLHSSKGVPSSITNTCSTCHSNSASYATGAFHTSLSNHSPGLAQPSACNDCHLATMPTYIVGDFSSTKLAMMDHAATFTSGSSISPTIDCADCHKNPGGSWSGGTFHATIGNSSPASCMGCHLPVMPTAITYQMAHTSSMISTQDCNLCHALPTANQAASPASTNWSGGLFHIKQTTQPSSCTDCHSKNRPNAVTVSDRDSQHMSHQSSQVATDCASCHASDIPTGKTPTAFSKTDQFHSVVSSATTCQECHGLKNGSTVAGTGAVAGTGNDLPAGLTTSTTTTTSSVATAGTYDQITHNDINVANRECNTCHTNQGMSAGGGTKWKAASFHVHTTTLILNGTTGRCDNCHSNIKPSTVVSGMDHSSIGAQDCAGCHSYPGTGTAGNANWKGANAAPQYIPFPSSNFVISPPATDSSTAATAVTNLPHPNTNTAGYTCSTCHTANAYRPAIGYDHGGTSSVNGVTASTLIKSNCASCHEATILSGSNNVMVGTPFPTPTPTSTTVPSGDTRPIGLSTIPCPKASGSPIPNIPSTSGNSNNYHFYPSDCSLCHTVPATTTAGTVSTNSGSNSAWKVNTGTSYPSSTGGIGALGGHHPPQTGQKSNDLIPTSSTGPVQCAACHANGCG